MKHREHIAFSHPRVSRGRYGRLEVKERGGCLLPELPVSRGRWRKGGMIWSEEWQKRKRSLKGLLIDMMSEWERGR